MMKEIIQKDQELLIFLNNLGTEFLDPIFMYITHQINWWPFFLLLIFLMLKKISWKEFGLLVLVLTLFFVFTDQSTNIVKKSVQRLRPVNDSDVLPYLRYLRGARDYSFFSGHASNSSGAMLIIFYILKRYYKYAWLVLLFPLLFAYTRLYLALHYPLDILCGFVFGTCSGLLFIQLYKYLHNRFQLKDRQNKNAFV